MKILIYSYICIQSFSYKVEQNDHDQTQPSLCVKLHYIYRFLLSVWTFQQSVCADTTVQQCNHLFPYKFWFCKLIFFLNMFMNVDESYRRQYKLPCCYSINWLFFFLNRDFSPVWIFLFQCLHWLLVNKLKMLYLCAGILLLYQTHIHTLMYNLYTYRNLANPYWDVRLRNNWYRVHDQTTCRFRKYIHFLTILDCMVSVSC